MQTENKSGQYTHIL